MRKMRATTGLDADCTWPGGMPMDGFVHGGDGSSSMRWSASQKEGAMLGRTSYWKRTRRSAELRQSSTAKVRASAVEEVNKGARKREACSPSSYVVVPLSTSVDVRLVRSMRGAASP